MSSQQPIGIFDSGIGGLSVLRHVHDLLPDESLIYVADGAHMPYGSLTAEEIEDRFDIMIDGIPYDRKFVFEAIGYNFLPLELMAAFGLVQLSKLSEFGRIRRENFQRSATMR